MAKFSFNFFSIMLLLLSVAVMVQAECRTEYNPRSTCDETECQVFCETRHPGYPTNISRCVFDGQETVDCICHFCDK